MTGILALLARVIRGVLAAARDARHLAAAEREEAKARRHLRRARRLSRQRTGQRADHLITDLNAMSERLSGAGKPPSGAPLSDGRTSAPREPRAGSEGAGRRTSAPSFSQSRSGVPPSAPLVDASRSGVPPSAPLDDTPKKGERR